jgi:hypothetical protein
MCLPKNFFSIICKNFQATLLLDKNQSFRAGMWFNGRVHVHGPRSILNNTHTQKQYKGCEEVSWFKTCYIYCVHFAVIAMCFRNSLGVNGWEMCGRCVSGMWLLRQLRWVDKSVHFTNLYCLWICLLFLLLLS